MSEYKIAVIGVGATILGAVIGAYITYYFSIRIAERSERQLAVAKLRAAFAPAIAKLYLSNEEDFIIVRDFFKEEILRHVAAIEEFRPFVTDNVGYKKAGDEYHEEIDNFSYRHGQPSIIPDNVARLEVKVIHKYGNTVSFYSAIKSKINEILLHCPINA